MAIGELRWESGLHLKPRTRATSDGSVHFKSLEASRLARVTGGD
jgi:hypothetical protein